MIRKQLLNRSAAIAIMVAALNMAKPIVIFAADDEVNVNSESVEEQQEEENQSTVIEVGKRVRENQDEVAEASESEYVEESTSGVIEAGITEVEVADSETEQESYTIDREKQKCIDRLNEIIAERVEKSRNETISLYINDEVYADYNLSGYMTVVDAYPVNFDISNDYRNFDVGLFKETPDSEIEINVVRSLDIGRLKSDIYEALNPYKVKRVDARYQIRADLSGADIAGAVNGIKINTAKLDADLAHISKNVGSYDLRVYLQEDKAQVINEGNLGSFAISYKVGGNSEINIKVAAERINGTILAPGQQLSVNKKILQRNAQNGYVMGASFNQGVIEQSYGGGICQLSSVMYGAVLRGGLQVDERWEHSGRVSYVPIGLDAAIAGDYKDLKFTNNYNEPIYIRAEAKNGILAVNIYSNTDVKNGIEYNPISVAESNLKAKSFLQIFQDRNLIDTKYLDSSSYLS